MSVPSLFERLGGAYPIAYAVDLLIDSLQTNATLNNTNEKVAAFHSDQFKAGYKFMVTAFTIEATGGPKCYIGRDMFEAHKDLGLTHYEFDVTCHEIRNTLYKVGAPKAEIDEFMGLVETLRGPVVQA